MWAKCIFYFRFVRVCMFGCFGVVKAGKIRCCKPRCQNVLWCFACLSVRLSRRDAKVPFPAMSVVSSVLALQIAAQQRGTMYAAHQVQCSTSVP